MVVALSRNSAWMYDAATPRFIFPKDGSIFTVAINAITRQRTLVGRRFDEIDCFSGRRAGMALMVEGTSSFLLRFRPARACSIRRIDQDTRAKLVKNEPSTTMK